MHGVYECTEHVVVAEPYLVNHQGKTLQRIIVGCEFHSIAHVTVHRNLINLLFFS
jgi:hypothetical protein